MLNWNSLNIPSYIANVYSRLRQVDLLVKQVNDIRDARIDAVLQEISKTVLCELPKDDPWTIDLFLSKTQVQKKKNSVLELLSYPASCILLFTTQQKKCQLLSRNLQCETPREIPLKELRSRQDLDPLFYVNHVLVLN